MTGYSTSMVIVGLTAAKVRAAILHNSRDVHERDGLEPHHDNPMIDSSRTASNKTFVNDGNGHLVPMTDLRQAYDYLDKRLSECPPLRRRRDRRTGKVTKTATTPRVTDNLAAEWVLSLDPAWLRDMTREEYAQAKLDGTLDSVEPLPERLAEAERLLHVMLNWLIRRQGIENVVTYSIHLDESNPHIQVIVVAIARDDDHVEQLSYKMAFASGKRTVQPVVDDQGEPVLDPITGAPVLNSSGDSRQATQQRWRGWHNDIRDDLNAAGYPATYERVDGGRKAQKLSVYKWDQDRRRDEHQTIARQQAEIDRARAAQEASLMRFYQEASELDEQRREFAEITKKRLRQITRDQQAAAELRAAAQLELEVRNEDRRRARADRQEALTFLEQARAKFAVVEKAVQAFKAVEPLIAKVEKVWATQPKAAEQARQVRKRLNGPREAAIAALAAMTPNQQDDESLEL